MPITVHTYRLGPMENNTYLLVDEATGVSALVDPSFESETLEEPLKELDATPSLVLNTHAHFDHVIGNRYWVRRLAAPLALHPADTELLHSLPESAARYGFTVEPSPQPTFWLEHGQNLPLGESELQVRHVPGHAPGHVIFVTDGLVIAGDCLFKNSIGRTDLPGGDLPQLLRGIAEELLTLPDETVVYPGHGEATTIGAERKNNPYLASIV